MTETLTIEDLSFRLRRSSRRRTLGITVERDGTLLLDAPPDVPTSTILRYVEAKREWIYLKLEQKEALLQESFSREFDTGERFWYLGRKHALVLVSDETRGPLRLYRGRFELRGDCRDEGYELFVAWYRTHLRSRVGRLASECSQRLGVQPGRIRIQDLGYRWGSSGPAGTLNFHWRTALLPPELIEYIVAHEVAHLIQNGHGPRFWMAVEMLVPGHEERKTRLAHEGPIYGI